MSCSFPASYCWYFCLAKYWYHWNNRALERAKPTTYRRLMTVLHSNHYLRKHQFCSFHDTISNPEHQLSLSCSLLKTTDQQLLNTKRIFVKLNAVHLKAGFTFWASFSLRGKGDIKVNEQGSMCTRACVCTQIFLDCIPELFVNKPLWLKNTQSKRPHTGVLKTVQKTINNEKNAPMYFCKSYANGQILVIVNKQGQSEALECFSAERRSYTSPLAVAVSRCCVWTHSPPPLRSTGITTLWCRFSSAVFMSTASRLPDTWPFWIALMSLRHKRESILLTHLQDKEQRLPVQPLTERPQ